MKNVETSVATVISLPVPKEKEDSFLEKREELCPDIRVETYYESHRYVTRYQTKLQDPATLDY